MAQKLPGRASEQPLARAIDQHQPLRAVMAEIDVAIFAFDSAQQRRCLLRAEPLPAQRLGERVDLHHHVAERVVRLHARANGEVVLAKSGQQVGDRLKWIDDAVAG